MYSDIFQHLSYNLKVLLSLICLFCCCSSGVGPWRGAGLLGFSQLLGGSAQDWGLLWSGSVSSKLFLHGWPLGLCYRQGTKKENVVLFIALSLITCVTEFVALHCYTPHIMHLSVGHFVHVGNSWKQNRWYSFFKKLFLFFLTSPAKVSGGTLWPGIREGTHIGRPKQDCGSAGRTGGWETWDWLITNSVIK